MTKARRAAVLAATSAVVFGGTLGPAAPAPAQTDPTKLWTEYPLEPAPPPGLAKAALPRLTPPAVSEPSENRRLLTSGLAVLFVACAGAAAVALSVFALRLNERRNWY
jgi:hypothetical protein